MTELVLDIPPEIVALIAREAEARGVTVETLAAQVVETWAMFDDEDWDEGPEPESENVPLDQAFDELLARVAAARAAAR